MLENIRSQLAGESGHPARLGPRELPSVELPDEERIISELDKELLELGRQSVAGALKQPLLITVEPGPSEELDRIIEELDEEITDETT